MERYWSIRWLGAQAGMPTESWSRSPDQPPIIEPAVAGREGLFRLRRAPAIVRLPDWSQLAPGTEVQVELLSGDALDIHLEARGHVILKESRVDHYAVLGSPIAHSRSPFIHHAFAGQSEAALQYDRIETSAEALAQTLDRLWAEGYKGLNLTIPLKEAAFALAQTRGWNIAPRAQAAGAVNTLVRVAETNQTGEAAEGGSWSADNTDGIGLVRDLTRILGDGGLNGNEVLIIGAGGATRGLISPFRDAGLQRIVLANRSVEKAIALAEQMNHSLSAPLIPLGLDALQAETLPDGSPWPSLVINATAASLEGASLAVHPRIFTSAQLVLDLMYGPKAEVFLGQARAAGAPLCADGLGMLVEQAAESFFLWTGQRPDTEPVREALVAALESDA